MTHGRPLDGGGATRSGPREGLTWRLRRLGHQRPTIRGPGGGRRAAAASSAVPRPKRSVSRRAVRRRPLPPLALVRGRRAVRMARTPADLGTPARRAAVVAASTACLAAAATAVSAVTTAPHPLQMATGRKTAEGGVHRSVGCLRDAGAAAFAVATASAETRAPLRVRPAVGRVVPCLLASLVAAVPAVWTTLGRAEVAELKGPRRLGLAALSSVTAATAVMASTVGARTLVPRGDQPPRPRPRSAAETVRSASVRLPRQPRASAAGQVR